MNKIKTIYAHEVLDSHGNPTVEVEVTTEKEAFDRTIVSSGASIGIYEAVEARDGDKSHYLGKGIANAMKNVSEIITLALIGQDIFEQRKVDQIMIELDGTDNKGKLGANAGQIKTGSASRIDRIAKYNQLIRIEDRLGKQSKYFGVAGSYQLN